MARAWKVPAFGHVVVADPDFAGIYLDHEGVGTTPNRALQNTCEKSQIEFIVVMRASKSALLFYCSFPATTARCSNSRRAASIDSMQMVFTSNRAPMPLGRVMQSSPPKCS
jgi:hypothetical protein